MKELWTIFATFFRIGVFTFGGGYAMIPLVQREVIDKKRWIERENFLQLLTLAQSAPGPIALNAAVFVGYKVRGYCGAVAAVLGVVIPSFVIMFAVAMFFAQMRDNRFVNAAFLGMRPAVVALIIAPIAGLSKGMGAWNLAVAAAVAVGVWHFGLSPVLLILVGAAAGIGLKIYKTGKENIR